MDSLLSEMGGESIGLNVVCEENRDTLFSEPKKRKKNNKFEKRRAKSRRAKAQRDGTNPKAQSSSVQKIELKEAQDGTHDKKENITPLTDENVEKQERITGSKQNNSESQSINSSEGGKEVIGTPWKNTIKGIIQPNLVLMPQDSLTKEEKDYVKTVAVHPSTGNPIHSEPIEAMSRKNQHETTARHLEDQGKRAEYMSNFHARPHEMDRKSGAVSHIKKSKESEHIYGDLDENEETGKGCPFLECGLHQRIANAVKSSKGRGLSLKRPTVIQRNAWSQMLKDNKIKGERSKKNLLIQSETGSGKTLAYFLPMLQVRYQIVFPSFQCRKII